MGSLFELRLHLVDSLTLYASFQKAPWLNGRATRWPVVALHVLLYEGQAPVTVDRLAL